MNELVITEWATWITDLILALQCFYLSRKLWFRARSFPRLWSGIFFLTGIAAFIGVFQHGFYMNFGENFAQKCGTLIIGILAFVSLLLGWSFSQSFLQRGIFQKIFQIFLVAKCLFFLRQAWLEPRFLLAIVDYGSTLVLLLMAYGTAFRSRPGAVAFVSAILIAIAGATVQSLKLAPHPLFNHNDLFHVIQMLSFYFFYRGACREDISFESRSATSATRLA